MAMTHVIFDICAMPEYAELLRSEAQTALAQDGGQWQFSTIQKLRRLDSFLKESQRMNQSTFLGFDRKVISTIKLPDGKTILRAGTTVTITGVPMSRDSRFYDRLGDFDGLRFYHPD